MNTPTQPAWRDVDTLVPYEKNAKKHGPEQVKKIAASIKKYGWRGNPIIVDTHGVIIAGHGRRLAAISLGMNQVPVIVEDMTEDEARAYRLADNRAAEGGLDHDILKAELLELPEFVVAGLGDIFDKKELDFAVADLMDVNMDVFSSDLDGVMDDVQSTTDEKIVQAAEKRVGLDKALGFKTVKGSDVIVLSRFMALITGETGLEPEQALIKHAQRVMEGVA